MNAIAAGFFVFALAQGQSAAAGDSETGDPNDAAAAEDAEPIASAERSRDDELRKAAEELASGHSNAALARIEEAITSGGMPKDELARAWHIKGRALAFVGDGRAAQEAYAIALRIDPAQPRPDTEDGQVTGPYDAAKAMLPDDGTGLAASAAHVATGSAAGPGVEVRLIADDLALVAAAELRRAGRPLASSPLSQGAPLVHLASGQLDPADLTVSLLDEHRNELLQLEVAAPDEGPGFRWLTLGGAGVMTVGAAALVASGIGLSALDRNGQATPEIRTGLLAGIFTSAAVIAAGGVLVVVDQLFFADSGDDDEDDDATAAAADAASADADAATEDGDAAGRDDDNAATDDEGDDDERDAEGDDDDDDDDEQAEDEAGADEEQTEQDMPDADEEPGAGSGTS